MPFEPPVRLCQSVATKRINSPNRNVTSTKYFPDRRSSTGPISAANAAGARIAPISAKCQGHPALFTSSTDA